jgi:hypothetical protein
MVSYNLQNKRVGILNSHGLWPDTYLPLFVAGFQCSRDGRLIDNKREAVASRIINANQRHDVSDCFAVRCCSHLALRTTADRMAADRKLDRRRVYRCAGGLGKRA